MKHNNFFANVASKALALAATVMMMSAAFTACSSSNNDDDGGGGTPPPPTPKAQTVTLDGKEIKIEKANLTKINEDTYWLGLTLEAGKEATDVIIALEPLKHNGKQIDLTEQKTEKEGGGWSVAVLKGTKWLCCGEGRKGDIYKFSSGTMTLNVDPTTKKAEVRLTGGKITTTAKYNSGDGKEHTLAINYEGTAIGDDPTPEPLPEPKAQTVTLDGKEKPIVKAEYEDYGDGNYNLYLYFSADGKERVKLELNKDLHMTGSSVDLTKKEETHDEWYWAVDYYKPDNTKLINTFGKPGHISPVFTTGTLTMSGSFENINIKLENGRVEGTDGKKHTLVLSYSGTMEKSGGGTTPTMEYVDLGLSVKWARCNLGASKPTDYGDYFAWGETEPNKTNYSWATYKWMQTGKSDWKHITKYTLADGQTKGIWYDSDGNFIGDNKTTLEAADDAATANLGSPWRMPTEKEYDELVDHCTWTWTTQDGVKGYEVKSKKNGNSIFLPAAGHRTGSELKDADSKGFYWSSSLNTGKSYHARDLYFYSGGPGWSFNSRYFGFPVRPVRP